MASPADIEVGIDEEPTVAIRCVAAQPILSEHSGGPSYQSTSNGAPAAPAGANGAPPTSVNSTNSDAVSIEGSKADKAPLLLNTQRRFLRGLSASLGVGGMSGTLVENGRRDGLSTFTGVFAPVALSMFSVLLFLRMGYVVGQAGLLVTVAQLVVAYIIIVFTFLSLSAISTNGAIEGGGVYYMISRALGPEFGGAIGILFFLANVFSSGLYITGFRETLINNFGPGGYSVPDQLPSGRWWWFLYDLSTSVLLVSITMVGAGLFAKCSLVVLAGLIISYGSFLVSLMVKIHPKLIADPTDNERAYFNRSINETDPVFEWYSGVSASTFHDNLYSQFGYDYSTDSYANFAVVFAVVFSGVTGIMAGANMSGELKRPDISIPKGTFQALVVTLVVYVMTAMLLAASCTPGLLQNNYIVMQNINVWPPFIVIGIFITTLFAALSNLLGASRVLLRVAEDRLFGFLLYPATLKFCDGTNPIPAVLISWVLLVGVLLLGSLNQIAQIGSIFFLLSYAGVNMACLALELASAPNFRPKFRYFTWHTALLGVVGSVTMMFVVNAVFTGVAVIFLLVLVMVLHYSAPMASWGSISQALIFHQVRKYLLLLDPRKDHVKYWRPQILLLVSNPRSNAPLIDFVNDIKKSGLYVIGNVKQARFEDYPIDPCQQDLPYWLALVDHMRLKAFVELTVCPSIREGIQHLTRVAGIGAMKPNTIFLGFYDTATPADALASGNFMQKLKRAKIDRSDIADRFNVLREENEEKAISLVDYVHIIHDILKMNKNVCLSRNFMNFDKKTALGGATRSFIDVWPVDMSRPSSVSWGFDNSCLFLLQLSCILNMVSNWAHRTTLRVFLCVTSLQDIKYRETQLRGMLDQLRIQAKTIMVPWDHVICHLSDSAPVVTDPLVGPAGEKPLDFSGVPEKYVRSMNETIRRHTDKRSAVLFINMPIPPPNEDAFDAYMSQLDLLSSGLPPTLLVHGISSVISTAL